MQGVEFHHEKGHRVLVIFRGEGLDPRIGDTDPQATGVPPLDPRPLDPAAAPTAELVAAKLAEVHEALAGERAANGLLLRGFDTHRELPRFGDRTGLRAAAVAVYPMYRGIARLLGFEVLGPPADLTDQIRLLEKHREDADYFFVHVKDADAAGEDGDRAAKIAAIERVDEADPGPGRRAGAGRDRRDRRSRHAVADGRALVAPRPGRRARASLRARRHRPLRRALVPSGWPRRPPVDAPPADPDGERRPSREVRSLTMCFDTDALPPDPARTGMGAASERTILVAGDGNRFAATIAPTQEPASAGVVVIPDVRGLYRYYERLAEHLADAGVHAVALDPYGRTAGAERREDDFDYSPHRAAVRDEGIRADVRAAAEPLRERGATRVLSMGFCFGGRASLMQASQERIDGVIAFYGPPTQGQRGRALAARGGASPATFARRSSVSTAGRTAGSRWRTWRPTTGRSRRPAWSIGSSCTRTPRTPSSTGRCPSTPRSAGTPGPRSWASSTACNAEPAALRRRAEAPTQRASVDLRALPPRG